MKIRRTVAYKIYEIREDLGIHGDAEHDWWLAGKFLQELGSDKFYHCDIYQWFVTLEENLVEKQTEGKWD